VPVTGLLALPGTWLQQSGPTTGDGGSDRTSTEQHAIRPAIDRSIVLIGNGYEHLRMKGGIEAFSIDAGSALRSDRDPAPGPIRPSVRGHEAEGGHQKLDVSRRAANPEPEVASVSSPKDHQETGPRHPARSEGSQASQETPMPPSGRGPTDDRVVSPGRAETR